MNTYLYSLLLNIRLQKPANFYSGEPKSRPAQPNNVDVGREPPFSTASLKKLSTLEVCKLIVYCFIYLKEYCMGLTSFYQYTQSSHVLSSLKRSYCIVKTLLLLINRFCAIILIAFLLYYSTFPVIRKPANWKLFIFIVHLLAIFNCMFNGHWTVYL